MAMIEHGKIEHHLPNGDILVQDSTHQRPEVEEAFRKVEDEFERKAKEAYEELQRPAAA
jgi:hypothetical protein